MVCAITPFYNSRIQALSPDPMAISAQYRTFANFFPMRIKFAPFPSWPFVVVAGLSG
jgi:hypothetical protein